MATLHLMVGLPGSGKTTEAKRLEKEFQALRLTTDEWHIRLFGNDFHNDPDKDYEHNVRHAKIEELIWETAKQVLLLDRDVILDFGCWSKSERDDYRKKAHSIGADFKIHYMECSLDEILKRLEKRNQEVGEKLCFYVSEESIKLWSSLFEVPTYKELHQDDGRKKECVYLK